MLTACPNGVNFQARPEGEFGEITVTPGRCAETPPPFMSSTARVLMGGVGFIFLGTNPGSYRRRHHR